MKRRATSPGVALRAACVAAAIAVGLPFASAAEQSALQRWLAGEVGLAAGFDYSEGDYGKGSGTKTKMLFLPFTLTYLFDDFALTPTPRDQVELRVIVPFISVAYSARVVLNGEAVLSSLFSPQSIGWLGTVASVEWKLSVIEQRGWPKRWPEL